MNSETVTMSKDDSGNDASNKRGDDCPFDPLHSPLYRHISEGSVSERPRVRRFYSAPRVTAWTADSLFVDRDGRKPAGPGSSSSIKSIFSTSVSPQIAGQSPSYFSPQKSRRTSPAHSPVGAKVLSCGVVTEGVGSSGAACRREGYTLRSDGGGGIVDCAESEADVPRTKAAHQALLRASSDGEVQEERKRSR